jgi:hypothetical protein
LERGDSSPLLINEKYSGESLKIDFNREGCEEREEGGAILTAPN